MADTNITFAKIVANPNERSWSQAYNAGKLFSVISLESTEEPEEKDFLNILGKEILDTLEQEFFTLETKNLESIKQAVTTTSAKIPSNISCSFVIASYVENVLYLYILGNGKISLKREDKLGTLLESNESSAKALKDASGYLQTGDMIILQTHQFTRVITAQILTEFVESGSPSEVAEHIAPLVHEKDEAGAAAIIINYMQPAKATEKNLEEEKEEEEKLEDTEKPEDEPSPFYSPSIDKKPKGENFLLAFISKFSRLKYLGELSHPRKVILTVVIIILVVFLGTIFFAIKKQQDSRTQVLFQNVYPQAVKKFDEGKAMAAINLGYSKDSFNEAKKILDENKNSFPKNSSEEKQILTLLTQVNQALKQAPKPNSVQAKIAGKDSSNLLNAAINNPASFYSESTDNIFALTSSVIYSLKKDGSGKKTVVENDSDWTTPGGFSNYFGNLYVLDKKQNQILKFVENDSVYTKNNYFSDNDGVDFSKAVSMAIDSSVYVLLQNGKINKYNKGASESFNLSGLDNELSSPTRIFTNADLTYVYVLDNGNSRIIVLEKNGKYKNQYQASIIKAAKDFDIDEKNNKAFVLSGGKIYEIELK